MAVRRTALLLALMPALCSCGQVLDPQGPVGSAQKIMLLDSLAIMLAIVVPTIATTLAFVIWFREGNTRARRLPDFVYSGRVEAVTWSIPILTVMFLSGIAWVGSHDLDPAKPLAGAKPVDVDVVSLDWKWLFIYPEQQIATVNQITVPAGVPIHFRLTSASVLNAFFVPQLGSMIYAMNGMADDLNLQADHPGTYYGLSSHFSGDGFSDMHFELTAVPPDQFGQWVQDAKKNRALDEPAYRDLSKQSIAVPPATYGSVMPGLFEAIVTQKLPPGPGPDPANPDNAVTPKSDGGAALKTKI